VLHKSLLKEQMKELKRKFKVFQKEQQKVKERIVCKEFNELIKNAKTTIYSTSASSLLMMKHKIVIYLLREYITKSEEQ